MGLLEKITADRSGRKSWSQPPFWSQQDPWMAYSAPYTPPDREGIGSDFLGYVRSAYKANGVVFACILVRQQIFSQARFGWREYTDLRPGALTDSPELALLRRPWPNGTTSELLSRMESVGSLAGNYYATTADDNGKLGKASRGGPGRRIVHLRPDWVTLVLGSPSDDPHDPRVKTVALWYEPKAYTGSPVQSKPWILMPDEVCHYSPIPDPEAKFRGMSWLTPILREIEADKAATAHKANFFKNGASLNTVVSLDKAVTPAQLKEFKELFNESHQGTENAYKTLFLGGGADLTVVGADMKQLDFKATQGAGESRIAADAGVHPTIVGLSEGMQGSSLNDGNFGAARRLMADKTMKHLWNVAAASLQTLLTPPSDTAELAVDTRDVSFLREDEKDAAEIRRIASTTIRQYVDAGFTPESAVAAYEADDRTLLVHSGLYSVQLQKPGSDNTTTPEPPEEEQP